MLSVELTANAASPTELAFTLDIPLNQGIVGVMGPSGCGKTTFLRTLCGLETRFDGAIVLDDETLWAPARGIDQKPQHRGIGMVFQDGRLFNHLTVKGNLEFAFKRALKPLFSLQQVVQWFGLDDWLNAPVERLSGGQKQRVALARAVIHSPRLLLLDEPFVSLDMASRTTLLNCLKQVYQHSQLPMILVSHDINDIRQMCRQLLIINAGQVTVQGETLHLLNQLATGLSLAQPITATLKCRFAQALDEVPLTRLYVGQQIVEVLRSDIEPQGDINCVIAADDVSISLSPMTDCSIVNCLQAKIKAMIALSEQHKVIELTLGAQVGQAEQVLYAQITDYSAQRLKLQLGQTVYALFKASVVTVFSAK